MRFDTEGNPGDIQDRRGMHPMAIGGGLGVGGLLLVLLFSVLTGRNPGDVLNGGTTTSDDGTARGGGPATGTPQAIKPGDAQAESLVRHATTDIENFWTQSLPTMSNGTQFRRTQLVLFTDATQSGCGFAQTATGPFYCPSDQLVYVDLGFYQELASRFGAPGQFAQAYVLAHEFGHHVQHLLGIDRRARATGDQSTGESSNSVALELQADCFAGVWGASAAHRGLLDAGEAEQGIQAAGSVGDDRLQRMSGRSVNPDSFTHGSSAERTQWFRRGMSAGQLSACTTFDGQLSP